MKVFSMIWVVIFVLEGQAYTAAFKATDDILRSFDVHPERHSEKFNEVSLLRPQHMPKESNDFDTLPENFRNPAQFRNKFRLWTAINESIFRPSEKGPTLEVKNKDIFSQHPPGQMSEGSFRHAFAIIPQLPLPPQKPLYTVSPPLVQPTEKTFLPTPIPSELVGPSGLDNRAGNALTPFLPKDIGVPLPVETMPQNSQPVSISEIDGTNFLEKELKNEGVEYQFGYSVNEDLTQFGHKEKRKGIRVDGEYYVVLPNGFRQVVTYYADETGYHPTIRYEPVYPVVEPRGSKSSKKRDIKSSPTHPLRHLSKHPMKNYTSCSLLSNVVCLGKQIKGVTTEKRPWAMTHGKRGKLRLRKRKIVARNRTLS